MKLAQPQIPPKKRTVPARAWRKGGLGGIPPRPSQSEAPPPCSFRAEPRKKVFFSFSKKKSGARKLKNVKKTFLRGGERQRAATGRQNSQSGFSSKKVRILTKRYRQFSEFEFWAITASPRQRRGSASARILKAFLKSQRSVRLAMRKFTERSSGKMKFCKPIFFLSPLAKG